MPQEIKTFTCKKAKVMPTASASMLVATASGSMVLNENESFTFSSFEKDSLIIFAPMSKSRPKAIQWSIFVMSDSNCLPKK